MASKAKDYDSIPQISGEGQEKEEQDMDYEDALNAQPVSRRQWLVVCICGLGNATDAIEVLSMSYILPVLDLPEQEKGLLSSAVFVGMLAGAVLAGFVADKHGRKPVLIVSMLFNAACTLAFSLTYNVYALAILRFFTGCGVGGAVPVVFSLASEVNLMPPRCIPHDSVQYSALYAGIRRPSRSHMCRVRRVHLEWALEMIPGLAQAPTPPTLAGYAPAPPGRIRLHRGIVLDAGQHRGCARGVGYHP